MYCLSCKSEIDNDSFFCDQCGEEIKLCLRCGEHGLKKMCTNDGQRLVTAREFHEKLSIEQDAINIEAHISDDRYKDASIPCITLSNNALGISIDIRNNDVFGRGSPEHGVILKKYRQISRRHSKFTNENNCWFMQYIGSSRTYYNSSMLALNQKVEIKNNTNLIIENIEFFIVFTSDLSDSSDVTIRC